MYTVKMSEVKNIPITLFTFICCNNLYFILKKKNDIFKFY